LFTFGAGLSSLFSLSSRIFLLSFSFLLPHPQKFRAESAITMPCRSSSFLLNVPARSQSLPPKGSYTSLLFCGRKGKPFSFPKTTQVRDDRLRIKTSLRLPPLLPASWPPRGRFLSGLAPLQQEESLSSFFFSLKVREPFFFGESSITRFFFRTIRSCSPPRFPLLLLLFSQWCTPFLTR